MAIEIIGKEKLAAIQVVPKEVLQGTDIIVVIDKSGSMNERSLRKDDVPKGFLGRLRGGSTSTRMDEVKEDALKVAQLAEQFDDDGITIIAFSSDVVVYDGVTSGKIDQIFSRLSAGGSTNLAAALREVVKKAEDSSKNVVAFVYTDGIPDSEGDAFRVINEAGKKLGRPKIGFCFIQVGEEPRAAAFLRRVNNDLAVDVCAAISASEAEGLKVEDLIWLAQNA